jgi:hypothetical protein
MTAGWSEYLWSQRRGVPRDIKTQPCQAPWLQAIAATKKMNRLAFLARQKIALPQETAKSRMVEADVANAASSVTNYCWTSAPTEPMPPRSVPIAPTKPL